MIDAEKTAELYARDGYYLAEDVFSPEELRDLEEDFDHITARLEGSGEDINARWSGSTMDKLDGGSSVVIHTHNVQRYSARWMKALLHDRFVATAQALLGPDVILHHTKLFKKPAREGAPFPMHQDWWYFPTQKDSMLAAVIFLSEASPEHGGFHVYPGSHKLGKMDNSSGYKPSELLDKYPLSGATPVNAKRGDVLFFNYMTLHGSTPNSSGQIRKTVLAQLHAGDDFVLDNPEVNHFNERLVLSGFNHHMNRTLAVKN